jgi:hypothetical protein
MKNIVINTPDGKKINLSAPDDATPDAIKSAAMRAVASYKAQNPAAQPKQPGMIRQAWDALGKPAEMAKSGLQQMAGLQTDAQNAIAQKTGLPIGTEPTGNMVRDVVANIPRIGAESMAEVAPSFVDRASILTAGAAGAVKGAGMVAGKVLPKVAPMLEAGSGLGKGTLEAAYKDPGMIADFGAKVKASEMYNTIKEGSEIPTHLKTNAGLVKNAVDEMAKGNVLDARDAFKARKAVKALLGAKDSAGSFPKDDLYLVKDKLDDMVFSSVKDADKMYQRAIRGEQMRNISRLNKNGTTGPVSAAVMAKIPALAPLMSPAIQGGAASAAGAASQIGTAGVAQAGGVGSMLDQGFQKLANRKGKRYAR